MKMKYCIMTAVAGLMLSNAQAATMVVSNVIDGVSETLYANGPNTASGLMSTGLATIGYFTSGYVISGNAEQDIAAFTIVSSAVVGGPSDDLGGPFAGYAQSAAVSLGTITTGNLLLNRPVYSFITSLATLAGSTTGNLILIQVGTIGNDVPFENAYSSNPALANPVAGYGAVGTFTGNAGGQGSATYRTLYAVPEPSAVLLGSIGVLGLLRRRRI
jgi:hypothetical protein